MRTVSKIVVLNQRTALGAWQQTRFASQKRWRKGKPLRQELPISCGGPKMRHGKKHSASGCHSIPAPDFLNPSF
jgi:hypothetical protein